MDNTTKKVCVYLEDCHIRFLSLLTVQENMNKSEILRQILDDEMERNSALVKEYEKLLFPYHNK